jgi:PhzF family phenazine biosynthesis protein
MPELIAGLIDVFADEPLAGNPLAVVQAAEELSEEQMRQLAGEFNQAETTFILESTRGSKVAVVYRKRCGDLRLRAQRPRSVALAGRAWRSWPLDHPADVLPRDWYRCSAYWA